MLFKLTLCPAVNCNKMLVQCNTPPSPLRLLGNKQCKSGDITKVGTSDTAQMKGTGHIYKWKRDLSASARVRWTKRRLAACLRLNICDFRRSRSARLKKDNPKSTNHKWSCEGNVDHSPQRIPKMKRKPKTHWHKNHIILKRFDPSVNSEEHYSIF